MISNNLKMFCRFDVSIRFIGTIQLSTLSFKFYFDILVLRYVAQEGFFQLRPIGLRTNASGAPRMTEKAPRAFARMR